MTKFSKKLVSKCVYVLILKNTDQTLVDLFMSEGGWNLIHTWLQDAIHISNWDLVKEILSLLLVTPVDVERLKLNNIPKLVKSLSKLEEVKGKSFSKFFSRNSQNLIFNQACRNYHRNLYMIGL